MLVLARKRGQEIKIGQDITLRVLEITKSYVRIGIAAPAETPIRRAETQKSAEPQPVT